MHLNWPVQIIIIHVQSSWFAGILMKLTDFMLFECVGLVVFVLLRKTAYLGFWQPDGLAKKSIIIFNEAQIHLTFWLFVVCL